VEKPDLNTNVLSENDQFEVINRLVIGHFRLTHSYLLSNDDVPLCETYRLPLTVKRILVECPSLQDIRKKVIVSSVKELFGNVDN